MALNVANWNDHQLDELVDMLKSADFSSVAEFISTNFLCDSNGTIGPRILTDDTDSTLRATIGVDAKTIVISAGVFVHAGKCSQIDTNETVNILATTTGSWGTGLIADGAQPRWDIICVKNNEQATGVATRWFVNDSTVPNTYYTQDANTLINKAYFDIAVVHGTPAASPVVPNAPTGYWTIAEIYVPASLTSLLPANVYDTTDTSNKTPANWTSASRILRMEFWASKFNVDHDPLTGYHRAGGWHIGSDLVTVSATEINTALDGIDVTTVTAAHLTKLTDTSTLAIGELHSHGAGVALGAWDATRAIDTVYQATTDGFVTAMVLARNGAADIGYLNGYTDGSNPPTTRRLNCWGSSWFYGTNFGGSFTMPVKKGDYWKVEKGTAWPAFGNPAFTVYWISFGT
jgi:hypothetical protein